MQTLKTAAIVVLLMTVMYSAYVWITTPPDSLPPHISELVESDSFSIEGGLSDAFAVDDGTGTPASSAADPGSAEHPHHHPHADVVSGSMSDTEMSLTPSSGSHYAADASTGQAASVDQPNSAESLAASSAAEATPTEAGDEASLAKHGLPAVSGVPSTVSADPNRKYPSTGTQFTMPDPQAAGMAGPTAASASPTDAGADGGEIALNPSQGDVSLEAEIPGADADGGTDTDAAPSTSASASSSTNLGLANAIRTADNQYKDGQFKEALATLSLFYDTPNLSAGDRQQLLSRLDPLAREVIYSTRHLLEQPHRVRQNETLMEIAVRYEVPWQLLANINTIEDPVTVLPGTDLKVVRGPFRADVDLTQNELTLFLGDLYAGRFPIAVGSDPSPSPGTFTVLDKQSAKTFYNSVGSPVPPGNPKNPYGSMWLDLGNNLCLHGSPDSTTPTTDGCISIAGNYAKDLYGILSQGSSVTIRR